MPKNKFLKLSEADAKAFYANGSITKGGVTYNVSDGIIAIVEKEDYNMHDIKVVYGGSEELHFNAFLKDGATFADKTELWEACGVEMGWAKPFTGYCESSDGYQPIFTLEINSDGLEATYPLSGAMNNHTYYDSQVSAIYIDGNPVAV